MKTIEATATTPAPPAAVWAQLADLQAWPRWGAWTQAELVEGSEHGPGAVRRLVRKPFDVRERVTDWVPGERMGYRLETGMKIRGHDALVTLEPREDGGTLVRWRASYEGGSLLHVLVLRMAVRDAPKRVARAAGR